MAELIPAGTGASAWFDFTVSAPPAGLFIKGATSGGLPAGAKFMLAHKSGAVRTDLRIVDTGNVFDNGAIAVPGTYSAMRLSTVESAGLDVEGAD